ncbi:ATP phosphoribosyltransferase regulatory subunit [Brevirhabdus pacifica]|uniref:ATP phosphoribosyltransferase regulatory subunit n=1 Tax=Brevirhabdus pacifica TaxID=1267768 RepID=A0A1U7DK38_9RHOB|nr:ATP phosphoribosyltransferase regulatory subunit [Brevirhabdus pacifica]APX90364.1 ATP phosphoribosyltransferase regulatory subunit [Brevirhabdus pacifica]OWU78605.1 ATP phosphoribosyltransferase [Loktanella sp. 22II-4b]PJJ80821.1 ATP phosphoribosyltransferase regulatory subunit [Brevirhabdus pacifica]
MWRTPEVRAEAARLMACFRDAGAIEVEADVLLPADTLLDLYGEDIRARAFTTADPLRGEQMLRPDFTVPVVQMHMAEGAEPARYTYAGKVFRRQEEDPDRETEYLQVGYELFDGADPAGADAEVFARIAGCLQGLPVTATTGDMGLLIAAVDGLSTTARRKAALRRHIWRPARFRALLERYSGRAPVPPTRAALLACEGDPLKGAGKAIGLRTAEEIRDRIAALHEDAAEAPLSGEETRLLSAILSLKGPAEGALKQLRDLAREMASLTPALDRFEARLEALAARGIDAGALEFAGSHGRASMEYYDGFVFAFAADARPELPPVATGGRYDALTGVLGQGNSIPAVGGVIRPGVTLALREGGA